MAGEIRTDEMLHKGEPVIPKCAVISASASGANTLVTAVTGKKIRVVALFAIAAGAVSATLKSHTDVAITGAMPLAANVPLVLPFNPVGYMETAVAKLLNLDLSAAILVAGGLIYIEVD